MRALYIGNEIKNNPINGGEYINYRNFKLLNEIFGENDLDKIEMKTIGEKIRSERLYYKINLLYNIFLNYMAGLDSNKEKKILEYIEKNKFDIIFLGSSQFGRLAYKIKMLQYNLNVITFFHNIEYCYFKEFIKIEGKSKFPLLKAAKYNEKKAVAYSDKVITLNSRDSKLLEKVYKRKSDLELPTSFIDIFDKTKINLSNTDSPMKLLFVGSGFFANYEGIKWFIYNVLPYISANLTIVGKGMEKYKDELDSRSVNVVGTVETLDDYYYNSDIIISPIFSGGGMKTKTAEALMYGKIIFGTQESFEGYNLDYGKIGEICNTAEDFINKINTWNNNGKIIKYNHISRVNFLERYSFQSSISRIKNLY